VVLRMVDITEISAMVAAAGVLVGVLYYIMDMRNQTRLRQTDLVMRLYSVFATEEFQKEILTLMTDMEIKDYNTFKKKYGVNMAPTILFFHEVGVLLSTNLADIGLINRLFSTTVLRYWENTLPMIEDARRQLNLPTFLGGFEYLYKELEKSMAERARRREQQASKTA
jgi:hypothetical protein